MAEANLLGSRAILALDAMIAFGFGISFSHVFASFGFAVKLCAEAMVSFSFRFGIDPNFARLTTSGCGSRHRCCFWLGARRFCSVRYMGSSRCR